MRCCNIIFTVWLYVSLPISARGQSSEGTIDPIFVSVDGVDSLNCGNVTIPCATLRYAVTLAESAMPAADWASIVLMAGNFTSPSFCAAVSSRPLNVSGLGPVYIDCAGSGRLLSSTSSLVLGNLNAAGCACGGGVGGCVSLQWSSVDSDVSAAFTRVVFFGNSCPGGGGAVAISALGPLLPPSVHFQDCLLQENDGGLLDGGALLIQAADLEAMAISFDNVSFVGNRAGSGAGASVLFTASNASGIVSGVTVSVLGCSFTGNNATGK